MSTSAIMACATTSSCVLCCTPSRSEELYWWLRGGISRSPLRVPLT
uniref:Uncharacterized protein n=1 Tax=Arundo donax TaxID=35708 RepID=A0A0A9A6J3_ARUDO